MADPTRPPDPTRLPDPAHPVVHSPFPDGAPVLDAFSDDPADHVVAAAVFRVYAAYCEARARAVRHRLAGDISVAQVIEARLDAIHASLPDWARW